MPEYPIPAIGSPVVITDGAPHEVTWDDSGDEHVGAEGTLTADHGPGWPARFTVALPDGHSVAAAAVRLVDDAYRAEQAAVEAQIARIDSRHLRLLQDALAELSADEGMPAGVRDRLTRIDIDARRQAYQEEMHAHPGT